jgi:hypothetical protein
MERLSSKNKIKIHWCLWSGIIPVEIRVQIEIEEYLMTDFFCELDD